MAPLNPTAAVCVNRRGHCGTGAQGRDKSAAVGRYLELHLELVDTVERDHPTADTSPVEG